MSDSYTFDPLKYLYIGIFSDYADDILPLDYASLNLQQMKLGSPEFTEYIESFIDDKSADPFKMLARFSPPHMFLSGLKVFVLAPIDTTRPVPDDVFYSIQCVVQLINPGNFRLLGIASYYPQFEKDKYIVQHTSYWSDEVVNSMRFLPDIKSSDIDVDKANQFLQLYLQYPDALKKFQVAFQSYFNSFTVNQTSLVIVLLAISVEALIDGKHELNHRIRRTIAVLNSDTKEQGEYLYKNMNEFYQLRSSIVHGEGYDDKKTYWSIAPFQQLVSATLCELMFMGFDDKKEIDKFVYAHGFGTRNTFKYKTQRLDMNPKRQIAITSKKGTK